MLTWFRRLLCRHAWVYLRTPRAGATRARLALVCLKCGHRTEGVDL